MLVVRFLYPLKATLSHEPFLTTDTRRIFLATTIDGKNITTRIRLWFETQQVMARIQLNQSEQALQQLQKLIWLTEPELRNSELSCRPDCSETYLNRST